MNKTLKDLQEFDTKKNQTNKQTKRSFGDENIKLSRKIRHKQKQNAVLATDMLNGNAKYRKTKKNKQTKKTKNKQKQKTNKPPPPPRKIIE